MSTTVNASELIHSAFDDGTLSGASLAALQIPDIGNAINQAIGMPIEIEAAEATHIVLLMDDSASIRYAVENGQRVDHSDLVCQGHNLVLEALRKSKARDGIFVTTQLLNGKVINAFQHIDNATELRNNDNYVANGGTPLYDQSAVIIGSAVVKAQELSDDGVPCRTVIVIVTDGMDEHSRKTRDIDVKSLVGDVLRTEQYIVAGMGLAGGGSIDFHDVFRAMGVEDRWILTPGESEKDIRAAFQLVSQSATAASQNAGSFSKSAIGGFGN